MRLGCAVEAYKHTWGYSIEEGEEVSTGRETRRLGTHHGEQVEGAVENFRDDVSS